MQNINGTSQTDTGQQNIVYMEAIVAEYTALKFEVKVLCAGAVLGGGASGALAPFPDLEEWAGRILSGCIYSVRTRSGT